ncbi:MAG: ParB/RepB/Spo0J family partition protein, partial [Oscillospiraceae bacterium]
MSGSQKGPGNPDARGERNKRKSRLRREQLPIAKVEPRTNQPRSVDEEALASWRIREYNQPVTVRPLPSGYYQLIAGERRWRAARLAGLTEIPAQIIEADDRLTTELALVENLQREDLNPVEEAQGYRTLMEEYGLTQDEAAQRVGKSRPAVANALRLLSLAPEVLQFVEQGLLSAGHARALVPIKPEELQIDAARQVIKNGLSVRRTEELAKRLSRPPKPASE